MSIRSRCTVNWLFDRKSTGTDGRTHSSGEVTERNHNHEMPKFAHVPVAAAGYATADRGAALLATTRPPGKAWVIAGHADRQPGRFVAACAGDSAQRRCDAGETRSIAQRCYGIWHRLRRDTLRSDEREVSDELVGQLRDGRQIALISDAGTPLISDPGFRLVRAARAAGIVVSPLPGPCAAIAVVRRQNCLPDRCPGEGQPNPRRGARS